MSRAGDRTGDRRLVALIPCLLWWAAPALPAEPPFVVRTHLSIETRTSGTTFLPANRMTMLDGGHLLHLGRRLESPSRLVCLDLDSLATIDLRVPDPPAALTRTMPGLVMDVPLWMDRAAGRAGVLLRGHASVAGDAAVGIWDLAAGRITAVLPLARPPGAQWTSVEPIGYDPDRGTAWLEVIRCRRGGGLPCRPPRGAYDVWVVAVTDRVRPVARFSTTLPPTTKSPYFDPVHRRSMHVEYAECGDEQTTGHLVDLDAGTVRDVALQRVLYGWAFDPADPDVGYAYSAVTGEVLRLNLRDGSAGARAVPGKFGHGLGFTDDRTLLVLRDTRLHWLDGATLAERAALPLSRITAGPTHVEGSFVLPGRVVLRVFRDLFVIDLPPGDPGTIGP